MGGYCNMVITANDWSNVVQSNISIKNPVNFIESTDVMEGFFTLKFRDYGNDWVTFYEKSNLIVNSARKVMAHVIGGDENWFINQLVLGGDNSVTASEMLNPNRPTISDTTTVYTDNLFVRNKDDEIDSLPAWSVSFPNSPNETSVLFSIIIGRNEANITNDQPTVYLSAGLYADSGNFLFASQSFPVITKTSERELLIEWNIRF